MEVKRKEECSRYEDRPVTKADAKSRNVGTVFEKAKGHDGVKCKFPFVEEKQDDCQKAEDDETNDCGTGPRVGDTAIFEAKEEHDGATNNGNGTKPVNGFEASNERRFGCFDVEKEQDDNESDPIKRH